MQPEVSSREEIWSYLDKLITDKQNYGLTELFLKSLSQLNHVLGIKTLNILLEKKIQQNSSVRQVASLIFRFGDNKMSMSKPYVALRLLLWCPSSGSSTLKLNSPHFKCRKLEESRFSVLKLIFPP